MEEEEEGAGRGDEEGKDEDGKDEREEAEEERKRWERYDGFVSFFMWRW